MHRLRSAALEGWPAFALLLLNVILVAPLFALEYPASFLSIEGAFIGIARHIQQNASNLSWYPFWYGGIPFVNTYPPLSHFVTAGWSSLSGSSVALAYHQVAAAFYCLIPPALYALARSLRSARMPAFVTGLAVSLVSPSAVLIDSVRNDLGSWDLARRLHVLVFYGEGPHIASIFFCLAALTFFVLTLTKPRPSCFVLASIFCAATALSNWLGAVALAFGALAFLFSMEAPFRRKRWLHAAAIGVTAYGIAAPWMPPSTIAAIRRNAPFVGGHFVMSPEALVVVIAAVVGAVVLVWVLRSMGTNRALRFSVLWAAILASVVVPSAHFGVDLLPQPLRYHIEMEIAIVAALVLGGDWFFREALDRRRVAHVFLLVLVALAIPQTLTTYRFARSLIQGGEGVASIEAETARWLAANLPGERVWLPGSVAYWANAFADVPQFGGGFDNGIQNPTNLGVSYQIYSSDGAGERDGAVAVTWLKAFGTRAVQVSLPGSPEYFHPFRNPAKFDGILDVIWEHREMMLYHVPFRHDGLAFVVPEAAIPQRRPHDGLDVEEASAYVAALDDATLPVSTFAWQSLSKAVVETAPRAGESVSIQTSYHPGWEAHANGKRIDVGEDGLGQIVLRTAPGPQRIELEFTGGIEQQFARTASWLSALFLAALLIAPARRRLTSVASRFNIA